MKSFTFMQWKFKLFETITVIAGLKLKSESSANLIFNCRFHEESSRFVKRKNRNSICCFSSLILVARKKL
ncbi:hypothetical protein B6D60_05470 [candidate division KSB1 bacterium 4484_87]|nr:MAG: hypothetical protein B6D60_05470 [candidate division KSB1 bacterium 4484_87]